MRGKQNVVSVALSLTLLAGTLSLTAAPPVLAAADAPSVQSAQDAHLGTILTGPNNMTLYVYTKDTPGTSNCYGQCAVNWPPLVLAGGQQPAAPAGVPGAFGTTTRKDGSVQVTFNGAPLYYWIKDKAPGQTTGQNVGGVWFVAQPGMLLDTAGTWAQNPIASAVQSGWLQANPDFTFKPAAKVTRGEFATALAAALKLPDGSIPAATGPDGAQPITRENAIAMLVQALGQPAASAQSTALDRFSDAGALNEQTASLVSVAVEQGLVQGYPDHTLRGGNPINRAEAAVLITRAQSLGSR